MKNYIKTILNAIKLMVARSVADWDQTDPKQLNYIKNKPKEATDEDAIALLTEAGVIDPVVDENNATYVDENGNIYSL